MRALAPLLLAALLVALDVGGVQARPDEKPGPARVKSAELRASDTGLRLVLKTRNVRLGRSDDVFVYPKVFHRVSDWVYAAHRRNRTWVVSPKSRRGREFIEFLLEQLFEDGSAVFKAGGLTDDARGGRLNRFSLRGLDLVAQSQLLPGLEVELTPLRPGR